MVNFFNIIEKNVCNSTYKARNGEIIVTNKLSINNLEVNIYEMAKGNHFFLVPPEESNSFKTYYILEGEIYNLDTGNVYSMDDMIYLDNNNEPFNFYVKSNVKLLVQSLNESSFKRSNQLFNNIGKILEEIHKKDDYTGKHSQRVHEYVKLLALKLKYSGSRLRNILDAAMYHDIGKIYIEDYILKKTSPLTEQEFETMKTHVVKGKELILSCFNEEVYQIISQHHERIDGSGYPYGLPGKHIREEAKIIALCDSFEAMTSDRVYKKGKTIEKAIKELKELSGIKYDSRITDIFINEVIPKIIYSY